MTSSVVVLQPCSFVTPGARPQPEGGNRAIAPPQNFRKRMNLLVTATSYIILPPPKISVGCGPDPKRFYDFARWMYNKNKIT